MSKATEILGIDVGASGIKGAIVDVVTGELLTERYRVPTPQPATPKAMTLAFQELLPKFEYDGDLIGVGFPAIVSNGVALSAANIHADWIRTSVAKLWSKASQKTVYALNDADAAGIASVSFGRAREHPGVVIFLTIGTGIGSAMFVDGVLVPNTELGHFYMPNGMKSEHYASSKTRKSQGLSWDEWAKRFDEVLFQVQRLFSPDLILLGGGASKKFDSYKHLLQCQAPVMPAAQMNQAGTVGAAIYAYQQANK
ncbi:MAG: polyphosphate--glucose phosphotransferase [Saprospiraceae bacterium]